MVVCLVSVVLFFWILILWRWFRPLFYGEVKDGAAAPATADTPEPAPEASLVKQLPQKRRPSPATAAEFAERVEGEAAESAEENSRKTASSLSPARRQEVSVKAALAEDERAEPPDVPTESQSFQASELQTKLALKTASSASDATAEGDSPRRSSSSTPSPTASAKELPLSPAAEAREMRDAQVPSLAEEPVFVGLGVEEAAKGGEPPPVKGAATRAAGGDSLRGSAAAQKKTRKEAVASDSARIAKVHGVDPEKLQQLQQQEASPGSLQPLAVRSAQETVRAEEETN